MKLKNIIWFSLLLGLLVGGCQLFSPTNVETIVSVSYLRYWYLFPNGDYLIHGGPTEDDNFLVNLATKEKHELDCWLHWWDSQLFGCYRIGQLSVIDTRTLTEIPLTPIDLTKTPKVNIETLLTQAETIYQPEWITNTIYILHADYQLNPKQNYVIKGFENLAKVLQKYNYILIPTDYPKSIESPVSSPNGLYYYDFTVEGFAIFKADNDEIVAKFISEEDTEFEIGGWEIDSSGVYFHPHRFGFGIRESPQKILKLKVPDE